MNQELVGKVTKVTSRPVLGQTTGHRMVELEIEEGLDIGRGYWKFNVSLLRDSAYGELIRGTWGEARGDKGDFEDVGQWWDYAKCLLRTVTIDFAKEKRREECRVVRELEKEKKRIEEEMAAGYGSVYAEEHLRGIKAGLEQEEERKAEGCRVRSRLPHFEAKEPGLAYFSREEKRGSKRNLIYALRDNEGRVRRGTEEVIGVAHDFYTELYSQGDTDEGIQEAFLSKVDVGLTGQQREWCDRVIDKDEVVGVMKKMASGKSPGADGFPVEFWRFFWDIVGDDFMDVVQWVLLTGRVTESMSEGIIRLLFKKGDRGDVRNYRPVTLVNADYKMLSGCVAGRLSSVLPDLVHEDQTGLPGRRAADSIHVIADTVEYCQREGVEGALVFLDQEKCFDRVDHGFVFKTLATYGFGPGFLGMVRAFYNGATSRVLVNGVFSEQIRLGRGVRQGDSPSSLLYVLTAEVLANSIRKDSQIRGIRIRGREKKIGGFADDTQGFLTSDASITRFLGEVSLFERASGSRLNRDKTEGLWLGPWQDRVGRHHGLNWKDRIKVLGVWIGRGDLAGANFGEVYAWVRSRLVAWKGRPLSALGKAKAANVFFFSSLWYRTEVVDPVKEGRGGVPGYGELEKEVGSWLFWGRQEVGRDRLRDPYSKGGAQLVDIGDKVRSQRVLWLKRLLSMPEGAFPRVLADELIGRQRGGYFGVGSLRGIEAGLKIRVGGFYKGAVAAWSKLNLRYNQGNNPIDNYNLFYNQLITNETGRPLVPSRPGLWLGCGTVAELRVAVQSDAWRGRTPAVVQRCLETIPNGLAGADAPDFVLKMADGSETKLSIASFKEVYGQFRALVRVERQFEAKWENALGIPLRDEWKGIWEALHQSGASYRVRSAVWRQVGLNFWTCYMDMAYIRRGDGVCEMCGVSARERWH
ncbi:MAG: reverse transcriptase family protein, partial [Bacteroidota bacterium]